MQSSEASATEVTDTADQYLTFFLDKEEYGIEILKVQEIKSWGPCTPLPRAPKHVMGVINLRGAVVPIIDLRHRFNQKEVIYNATTAIIIVRLENEDHTRIVGLVVDRVSEVYHLDASAIQATRDRNGLIKSDYIRGIGQINEKMVILIDLDPVVQSSLEGVKTA